MSDIIDNIRATVKVMAPESVSRLDGIDNVYEALSRITAISDQYCDDTYNEYFHSEAYYFLCDEAYNIDKARGGDHACHLVYYSTFRAAFRFCLPAPSTEHPGQLALFQMADKRARDLRTAMKPGRAIRLMLPGLTESELSQVADKWKERFGAPNFTFREVTSATDIAKYYAMEQSPSNSPKLDSFRKSLAGSCMRHEFENLPCHPASIYGSGDFVLFVLLDRGKLAARCVARRENQTCGPIYANTTRAFEEMERQIFGERQYRFADHNDWIGARLQIIKTRNGELVGPYLDVTPRTLSKDDEYLTIDSYGEIYASETSGLLDNRMCRCSNCRITVDEDDIYSDDNGYQYCADCYMERYFHCESCEEYRDRDGLVTVNWRDSGLRTQQADYCEHCARVHASECNNGEYWRDEDTQTLANGETVSIEQIDSGGYTWCDLSEEYYPSDEVTIYHDTSVDHIGGFASSEYLDTRDDYFEHDDEYYHVSLREELFAETTE